MLLKRTSCCSFVLELTLPRNPVVLVIGFAKIVEIEVVFPVGVFFEAHGLLVIIRTIAPVCGASGEGLVVVLVFMAVER